MIFDSRFSILDWITRRSGVRWLACLLLPVSCLLISGCVTSRGRAPAATRVLPQPVRVPAQLIANFFFVESAQADGKTYRFMVDTGSSVTYVSSSLAGALKQKERRGAPPRTLPVRGANGREVELPAITLHRFRIGEAYFDDVPAVVYDFSEFSAHVGLKIDGIIGFPLFRDTLLTLDYPAGQLEIAPNPVVAPPPVVPPHGSIIAFNREQATPLVPVQMDNESFFVLIDSGSDLGLSLNPAGLHPRFVSGPRVGLIVGSLDGDKRQLVGRLEQNVTIGTQLVAQPVVDLTEQLSALGGELLRFFRLTFDQQRHTVTLVRTTEGPVVMPGRRSTGLSFRRFPNYWRLLAAKITYTFLSGAKETDHEVEVFELVP